MGNKRYPEITKWNVVNAYFSGMTYDDITAKYGVSRQTIARWKRQYQKSFLIAPVDMRMLGYIAKVMNIPGYSNMTKAQLISMIKKKIEEVK